MIDDLEIEFLIMKAELVHLRLPWERMEKGSHFPYPSSGPSWLSHELESCVSVHLQHAIFYLIFCAP